MKRIIIAIAATLLLSVNATAHSGKPDFHVIIDTDGALDDLRAISMLLAEADIQVLAITCSQGSLSPSSVYEKVNNLLANYHHEGIPQGICESVDSQLPEWASFSENIHWGNPVVANNEKREAIELISETIQNYPKKITLIALGSLKAYTDVLESKPELSDNIERIIWYNSHTIKDGFNHSVSPNSYKKIKQLGITLDIVANYPSVQTVNASYQEKLKDINSKYGKQINLAQQAPEVQSQIDQGHIQLWDDLVPLYIIYKDLFETKTKDHITLVNLKSELAETHLQDTIRRMLESGAATNNRVFNQFPTESQLYKPDYADILTSTITKYGDIEWKAIAMTNEVHGHTGIYSIIGAKMGIRAMEYFNVGVNNLTVNTFAGNKPPLSCFNDGMQISSGATIGQGLITISDSISTIPSAIITYNQHRISIALKPEIAKQMQREIKEGIQTHGLLTDDYWEYIEHLAIDYWSTFNRHDIFTIKPLNTDE